MNTLFKKHFWTLQLGAIAIAALLIAGGVNDVIAGKFFAVPAMPQRAVAEAGAIDSPVWGRVAEDDAAEALKERKVFNLDPADDEEAVEVAKVDEPEPSEGPKPDDELDESTLPIDLLGTVAATEADYDDNSVASLKVEGANKIGWVGSEFLDGKAKIIKIRPRHIIMREDDGKYTVVRLWGEKVASAAKAPGRGLGARRNGPKAQGKPKPASPVKRNNRANRIREGVKKTGAYSYDISRSMLDEELKNLAKLQSEARVVPHYKDQKYQGFKLVGVRPGSLYRALGVRSGDVIKAVNGTAIDGPAKGLELFNQLQNASSVNVDIERRGQSKALDYKIQ